MLDQETKQNIEHLRKVLVSKIPSPNKQVEQVTIGLMYKFLSDIDKTSVDAGGVKTYFINELVNYSWEDLLDTKLTGIQQVEFYSKAIEKFEKADHFPKLFRDIFSQAKLPYSDPSTFRRFIEGINKFEYTHSEKLGDSFEYLISYLGVQGNLGQFRTPRHIIDFIVRCVEPKINESILDPACGTAGFLVSSFKFILNKNTNKELGDQLNAEMFETLTKNIYGYDIEPEMVRLALTNLYLNRFVEPNVFEYDTLTQDELWRDHFDIILANPPFFTPDYGVQPHNKFSIVSKKAEVLFTNYIINHLKPKGRAAIIVPEGIIFRPQKQYRDLRKQIFEAGLFAVVNLPKGVFKPYAGVGTSIIFIDKSKDFQDIMFFSVKNDGFELNDNRNPIKENDLPEIEQLILQFKTDNEFSMKEDSNKVLVSKEKIADINYSFEIKRYITKKKESFSFNLLKIKDVCEIDYGTRIVKKNSVGTQYPVYGGGDETFRTDQYNREDQLIISRFGMSEKCVRFVNGKFYLNDSGMSLIYKDNVIPEFLNKILLTRYMQDKIFFECARGTGQNNIDINDFKNLDVVVPPLEEQVKILQEVSKIEDKNTILNDKIQENYNQIDELFNFTE